MLSIRWRLTLFNASVILLIAGVLIGILGIVAFRGVRTSVEETARARFFGSQRWPRPQPEPPAPR